MGAGGVGRVLAVASNTLRETIRERVLYNLVFFAIVMTLSGLLLSELSIRQEGKIIKDAGLAAMEVFGTLIAIFIGVGLVAKEIERRSLYPLLAKPLSRDEFFLGKFLGLVSTLAVNLAVMTAGLYATLLATRQPLDPGLLAAIWLIGVGLALVVAIALLFSAVASVSVAAIATFCLVLAGRYSDVLRNLSQVAPDAPRGLVQTLYYAVPNFRNFDIKDRMAYGLPVPWEHVGLATLYGALYIALALVVGCALFRRREMP
jgi:ABC-type transport system involved in multi-copper enzyme maturation permease subunit